MSLKIYTNQKVPMQTGKTQTTAQGKYLDRCPGENDLLDPIFDDIKLSKWIRSIFKRASFT